MTLKGGGEVELHSMNAGNVLAAEAAMFAIAIQRQTDRIGRASQDHAKLPRDAGLDEQVLGVFGVRDFLDCDVANLDLTDLAGAIGGPERIVAVIAVDAVMDQRMDATGLPIV